MAAVSFQSLLNAFGNLAGLPITTAGVPEFTTTEEARFCGRLNDAVRWLWFAAMPRRALPGMLTGKTVTLATGGKVSSADIEGSDFWSVWQSDPRAEVLMDREWARLRLEGTALNNADIQVRGGVAGTTVFVIYRKPLPVWTTVRLAEQGYAAGATAWFETALTAPADTPDGHVYRNISGALAAGDDIFDSNVWQAVTLDDTLQEIALRRANADRMRADNQLREFSADEYDLATRAMESALIGAEESHNTKPWLSNWNR